jgi:hypothetical protein
MVAFRLSIGLCIFAGATAWSAVSAAQESPASDHYRVTDDLQGVQVEAAPVSTELVATDAMFAEATGAPPTQAPGECNCCECQKKAADLKAAIAGAYKPLFYDNNFAYINNPAYDDWFLGDHFKQVPIGDCWLLDIGGQYRARYMDEQNMRGLGLTGRDDKFLLHRTRLFMNAKYSDWFRAYGEFIDAAEEFNNFPERVIEVDRVDFLNLFADARVWDGDSGDLWFRIGRQELLYGSERLISPLDWANTRRTFEGFKFFWQGADWNVDFFGTRPIIPESERFDSANDEQDFFGAWATYKAIQGQTYDFFAIQYNNDFLANDFEFTTLGGRWLGSQDEFLWEAEGGVQFGQNTDGSDHSAGFVTGGIGRKWSDLAWKPQLMGYYDWANGTDDRGAGNGFNHLFPLAHKYLGFMDLFGRSNIESPNVQLTMQPHQKLKVLVWYYYLFLENHNDTPYNVTMSPFNPGNAPASADLGHEIDLLFTYNINPRMDVVFGYSHFFAGDYYQLTPGVPYRDGADFFYTHFQWNF